MIDHVKITVSNLAAAKEYYSNAFEPLGYRVVFEAEGMTYFADAKGLDFGLGEGETDTGSHVGFAAGDEATVHACYEAALAAGGTDNGGPGLRPEYAADCYGAALSASARVRPRERPRPLDREQVALAVEILE